MKAKLEYIFDLPVSCFRCPFSDDIPFPRCIILKTKLVDDDERYGHEKYRKQRHEECPLLIIKE